MQIIKVIAALLAAGALPAGVGALRAVRAMRALYPEPLAAAGRRETPPAHDPERLTAAVLLDHAGTEVSDFLLPYELLAASGAFNVHAVAPQYRPATLTGGLDVMPHVSLAGFEDLPLERADLIVVPHMPDPDPRIIDWLHAQAQAGATVLSICTGAGVAAAAGVFDGRRATAHWGDLARFERRYPHVAWVRGVRYVDDGGVAASAGITSGVDATLHMIRRLADVDAMHAAAEAIGYTDFTYLADPATEQYRFEAADLILPLTAAFGRRLTVGVLLQEGVHETALAAAMDTYGASFTARTLTMTRDGRSARSRHGLTLLPRNNVEEASSLDRLLLPGAQDPQKTAELHTHAEGGSSRVISLPQAGPAYVAIQDALNDLASLGGQPIARFAAKRLEYRTGALPDTAAGWLRVSTRLLAIPAAATALVGLGALRRRASRTPSS